MPVLAKPAPPKGDTSMAAAPKDGSDDPKYTIPAVSRGLHKIKVELMIATRDSPLLSSKVCPLLEELGRELTDPTKQQEVLNESKDLISIWNWVMQDSSNDRQNMLAVTTLSLFLSMVVQKTKAADKGDKIDPLLARHNDGPREYVHLASSMMYKPLIRELDEGDHETQKRAAWCIHFLATIARDETIAWNNDERAGAATFLTKMLTVRDVEVKVAACHALSMSLQKDLQFRAHFAEAGGVPPLLKLIQDARPICITAAAGALHALTYRQPGWSKWVKDLGGVPALMHVLEKMPPGPAEHRFALLQVLWIFGNMAALDEQVTEELIHAGLLSVLFSMLVSNAAPGSDKRDSVVEGAAAATLEAILLGDVHSLSAEQIMEQKTRRKVAKKVVRVFGSENIEEFRASSIASLRHVAHVLMPISKEMKERDALAALDQKLVESSIRTDASNERSSNNAPRRVSVAGERSTYEDRNAHVAGEIAKERSSAGSVPRASMRTAIVIGVSNYDHLTKIKHATADAVAIGEALDKAGFTVTLLKDPDSTNLRASIIQFESRALAGSLCLLFFCGHGTRSTIDGHHYILPKNFEPAPPGTEETLSMDAANGNVLQSQAGDLDIFLLKLRTKGVRHTIIITDACFSNKYNAGQNFNASMDLTGLLGSSDLASTDATPASSLTAPLTGAKAQAMEEMDRVSGGKERGSGNSTRASMVGIHQDRKSRQSSTSGAAAATPKGPKSKATASLTPWSGDGLQASIVLDSSTGGAESIGPEKGRKHSLFVAEFLRFCCIKNVVFRKALRMMINTIRDHSAGTQIPLLIDNNEIPTDFKLVEEN